MTLAPTASVPPLLSRERLAASLAALVRINSVNPANGGPEGGEAKVAAWVAGFFREAGLASEIHDAMPGRPNLTVTLPGRDTSRTILYCTHSDTVSIKGMTIDPHGAEIREGRLWGRGATDAKAQVVSMIHALAAIAAAGVVPPVNIRFTMTCDEESGFGGVKALVRRGLDIESAVIGEPTGLGVVVAHKGTQRWWVEFEGRSAHSAKPHLGVNAIEQAAAFALMIQGRYRAEIARRVHPLLGSPTVNVSVIEGGTQVNLVPQACRILLDRRTLPGETRAQVEAEIEAVFEALRAERPDFKARNLPALMVDPPLETAPDDPLARAACAISRAMGRPDEPVGVPYGTDGSKLSEIGIPTIVVGPGSIDQAHTADEFVELDELAAGARYFHQLMLAEHAR